MKRYLVALGLVMIMACVARADRYGLDKTPEELQSYFWGMNYQIEQGSVTAPVTVTTITFNGYATNISILSEGGQAMWWSNFTTNASTGVIRSGISFSSDFAVPASSPTRIYITSLDSGATVQYAIGGLKKKDGTR